jgi:hypothetical protein
MGEPKHNLRHPSGGTWGNHLVTVFETVFPDGPVQVLGEALAGRPDLPVLSDPRQGPAVALQHWALAAAPVVDLWWIVACDQVRWRATDLDTWVRQAETVDPGHERWLIGRFQGHLQPLGSLLPHRHRPLLAVAEARSLGALVESLPHHLLDSELPGWRDVDTSSERARFEAEPMTTLGP